MRHWALWTLAGAAIATGLSGCGSTAAAAPSQAAGHPSAASTKKKAPAAPSKTKTIVEGASQYQGKKNLDKYESAAAKSPSNFNAQIQAGVAAFNNNQPQQAISYYKAAMKIDPHKGISYDNIGNVYRDDLHNYTKALQYYQECVKEEPTCNFGWYNQAFVDVYDLHNTKAAQLVYQAAQKALPATDPYVGYIKKMLPSSGKS
ncbi:MAG: tetratricopeptide repeat protein [Firmicutes bacterium]|nr:tetratricopeptide repeat protein [Bacillota bacterium]